MAEPASGGARAARGIPTIELCGLALVAVVARVALAMAVKAMGTDPAIVSTADGAWYLALADGIRATGTYGIGVPEVYRPPAYPLLLACCSPGLSPVASAVAINIALSVPLVVVVALTASQMSGRRAGLVAGGVAALSPDLLMWSVAVMAETWLALMVAVVGYALWRHRTGRSGVGWYVVSLVAAAAAAYAKIIAYPLPFALVWVPLFDRRRTCRERWRSVALGLSCVVLLVGPWHVRNGVRAGYWGFSTQFARAALFTVAAGTRAEASGMALDEARELEASRVGADSHTATGDEARVVSMWQVAADRLREWPAAATRVYLRGVAISAIDPSATRVFDLLRVSTGDTPGWWTVARLVLAGRFGEARRVVADLAPLRAALPWLLAVPLVLLWALATRGALAPTTAAWRSVAFGLVAYFLVLSGGPAGSARFRVPVVPVLAVLAGAGVASRQTGGGAGSRPPSW